MRSAVKQANRAEVHATGERERHAEGKAVSVSKQQYKNIYIKQRSGCFLKVCESNDNGSVICSLQL